jgi:hypothetical protein
MIKRQRELKLAEEAAQIQADDSKYISESKMP